jgi:endonuclease/exonuclease/phosphatase family metal-dependent hydrolase
MRVSENKGRTSIWLKILLWINILNSLALLGAYLATHISPNSFIYLAFLGLSYPVWLLAAVGFMVIWFFAKPRWMLVSAITLLIGFNHLRHFIAITLSQPTLENPVKIMSFNVKIFNLYEEDRVEKRNGVFSFLAQESPEIICFQEFYHEEEGNFVTKDSMVQLLEMPYYHERYTHKMAGEQYFGVATFSKYPIIHKGEIAFENDVNNFCIYSDVLVGGDTLRIFNAHIGSIRFQNDDYAVFSNKQEMDGETYIDRDAEERIVRRLKTGFEKRAVQVETIALAVEASPYPVVFCGDLNDTPVSYCYRQLNRLLNDAFVESGNGTGTTYVGKMPSNRIDYIFHSASIQSSNFTTHDVNYSDHLPISCWIDPE